MIDLIIEKMLVLILLPVVDHFDFVWYFGYQFHYHLGGVWWFGGVDDCQVRRFRWCY